MTIEEQVKKAILVTCGMGDAEVSELNDKVSLSAFVMNEMQQLELIETLNSIVHAENAIASISIREYEKSRIVKDCISLVNGKIINA